MEEWKKPVEYRPVTILDVLGVDLCARAIFDGVPVADLVRSERVSRRWQRAVCHYLQAGRTLSFDGCYDSRRWQHAVCSYLQAGRTLSFDGCYDYESCEGREETYHRTICISNDSMPLVRKTLNKWGPYIVRFITDHIGQDTYLDIIVSECPNLEQIQAFSYMDDKDKEFPLTQIKNLKQLKRILLRFFTHSDLVLGELFQDINCENIIFENRNVTGSFLKSFTSDSLKSLQFFECCSLSVSDLLSAIDTGNLRNVTSLKLEESKLNDVHLLLSEMTQLEEFTYYYPTRFLTSNLVRPPLGEEWIQAFTRLSNLKRLTIGTTEGKVNDTFLEALARGCKKLEYLAILGPLFPVTVRGVRALCRRSPSARTKLHFPRDSWDFTYCEYNFSRVFKPLYEELSAPGCVELTLESFVAACLDPRGLDLSLKMSRASRAEEHQKELKLIIDDDEYYY